MFEWLARVIGGTFVRRGVRGAIDMATGNTRAAREAERDRDRAERDARRAAERDARQAERDAQRAAEREARRGREP